MFLSIVDFFADGKNEEKHKLAFSWLSLVLFSMKILCIEIYGKCYQKCMGGYHVSQEIERGDIIVYETAIYKAVVVSASAS